MPLDRCTRTTEPHDAQLDSPPRHPLYPATRTAACDARNRLRNDPAGCEVGIRRRTNRPDAKWASEGRKKSGGIAQVVRAKVS